MYAGFHEDGDRCPESGCGGSLHYPPVMNCSCHIAAPCSDCTDRVLTCRECGWQEEAPDFNDIPVAPGLVMREYKPTPLDPTKIDYRIKMHTSSTQICEGVYPIGATSAEVESVVRGTFGGRFEKFRDGKFLYVAYTD